MRTRWLVAGVLAAVCSVALAACDDGVATPTGTPSTQSPTATGASSSSTPTPTKSLTPEQQDLQDAEQSIIELLEGARRGRLEPRSPISMPWPPSPGAQALAQWQSTLAGLSLEGPACSVGNSRASADAIASRKKDGQVHGAACLDVTTSMSSMPSGKSVVVPSRPIAAVLRTQSRRRPQGFFVIEDLLKGEPCDA